MRNINLNNFIKEHNKYIKSIKKKNKDFEKTHSKALKTLKHERLAHLIVTFAVTFFCIVFFALYLAFAIFLLFIVFIVLLVLSLAYFLYYYKLENTVIKWETIDYKKSKKK